MINQTNRVRLRATPDLDAGAYSVLVEAQAGLSKTEYRLVANAVELFVSALDAGLGSGDHFSPWLSGASLVASTVPRGGPIRAVCLEVDRGAVRLLVNLICRMLDESGPLLSIVVTGERSDPVDSVPIAVAAVAYPAAYAQIPFDVGISLPDKSLEPITIRIAFSKPLLESEVDLLSSRFRLWAEIVAKGAYLQPDSDFSELPGLSTVEIYMLLPSEMEVVVYGFVAADAAFDGLVNMLARIRQELLSELMSVQIW